MTAPVRIMQSGPHAVLAEFDTLVEVMSVAADLATTPPAGVVDVVPAARTVLVTVDDPSDLAAVVRRLQRPSASVVLADSGDPVVVEVDYDGDDLQAVADACALTVDEVIRRHSAAEYTVAFCGFVPGFAYMIGLDPALHLPRSATPRTRVPAGAVAIASEFSAVYPTVSPGGWHLLGRTDAVMWDDDRAVPALLPPNTRVRFVAR